MNCKGLEVTADPVFKASVDHVLAVKDALFAAMATSAEEPPAPAKAEAPAAPTLFTTRRAECTESRASRSAARVIRCPPQVAWYTAWAPPVQELLDRLATPRGAEQAPADGDADANEGYDDFDGEDG